MKNLYKNRIRDQSMAVKKKALFLFKRKMRKSPERNAMKLSIEAKHHLEAFVNFHAVLIVVVVEIFQAPHYYPAWKYHQFPNLVVS